MAKTKIDARKSVGSRVSQRRARKISTPDSRASPPGAAVVLGQGLSHEITRSGDQYIGT
jgi:hypothetical protein